jgi:hypothetical protein
VYGSSRRTARSSKRCTPRSSRPESNRSLSALAKTAHGAGANGTCPAFRHPAQFPRRCFLPSRLTTSRLERQSVAQEKRRCLSFPLLRRCVHRGSPICGGTDRGGQHLLGVRPVRRSAQTPALFHRTVADRSRFAREQDYHQEKQRRHNRLLLGWDVVRGLLVGADPTSDRPWRVPVGADARANRG